MFDPILLAALLTTVLLGGALFRVLRSERRRANLEPLLSTIAMTARSADAQVFSLRRSGLQRNALPTLLSSRLDLVFASTGNRIGPAHLVAVGIAAAVIIGLVSVAASVHPILAIVLGGAAATGAPALLLRFAQRRYQRKFLEIFPDALDLIVRAVWSGLPAPEAIELVTHEVRPPVGTEFRQILNELRIGTEMEEALQRAADRVRCRISSSLPSAWSCNAKPAAE
jgi:tight adherence protein B